METDEADVFVHRLKELTDDEKQKLEAQNSRLIPEAKALKLEREARRYWDIFYKRNETKFFRDRHWTTREFQELINFDPEQKIVFLEMGCGVGNMLFPLVEEGFDNFYFYACDFSSRAVEFVKANKLYDKNKMSAFCADLTTDDMLECVPVATVDIASLIFVLSAIQPASWERVVKNAFEALRPGGILLFRDYGRYDMAQLRFKPGHKIADNFYMRQDGTRSYYFTEEELADLFTKAGFEILENSYVQRRTVNFKEGVDVPRIFVQGKYKKPSSPAEHKQDGGRWQLQMMTRFRSRSDGQASLRPYPPMRFPPSCLAPRRYRAKRPEALVSDEICGHLELRIRDVQVLIWCTVTHCFRQAIINLYHPLVLIVRCPELEKMVKRARGKKARGKCARGKCARGKCARGKCALGKCATKKPGKG